jgi:hypothetical protein
MFKEYPDKRVCTIDFLPLLEEAIKEVQIICKKYNIPVTTSGKGSTDITRFFYHYCLDKFCEGYKKCNSKYPKVIAVYGIHNKGITKNFVNKGLDKVLKVLPLPWCKVRTFNSPDTAMAAVACLSKSKLVSSKLQKFSNTNELYSFIKKNSKLKYFSTGVVDLPTDTE